MGSQRSSTTHLGEDHMRPTARITIYVPSLPLYIDKENSTGCCVKALGSDKSVGKYVSDSCRSGYRKLSTLLLHAGGLSMAVR